MYACSGLGTKLAYPTPGGCGCGKSSVNGCNRGGWTRVASIPVLTGVVTTVAYTSSLSSCQSGLAPYYYWLQSSTSCSAHDCTYTYSGPPTGLDTTISYVKTTCSGSSARNLRANTDSAWQWFSRYYWYPASSSNDITVDYHASTTVSPNSVAVAALQSSNESPVMTHQPQGGYMHRHLNEGIAIDHVSLDHSYPLALNTLRGGSTSTVIGTTTRGVYTADVATPSTLVPSHYRVGDAVPLTLDYAGFNGDEFITLFFSFVKSTGEERAIMQREYTTASGGAGRFEASWVVPWDMFYSGEWPQQQSYVVIRASNDMSKTYSTDKFSVAIFTDHDGVFTAPASYEVVTPGETYVVQWDHVLLAAYVPTVWNSPLGLSQVRHPFDRPTHTPLRLPSHDIY